MVENLPLKGFPLEVRLLANAMSENPDPYWRFVCRIVHAAPTDEDLRGIIYLAERELKRREEARRGPWFR